jgi:hypothetical protein
MAPFVVRAVRQFLLQPATDGSLADRVRKFCEDLERMGRHDWQVRQAEQALRIYVANFLNRTDWQHQPASPVVDTAGRVDPLAALQQLRARIRTRHYAYRTESSYADWARFFDYLAPQDGVHPHVTAAGVRDFLTHLAVHRHVSASTTDEKSFTSSYTSGMNRSDDGVTSVAQEGSLLLPCRPAMTFQAAPKPSRPSRFRDGSGPDARLRCNAERRVRIPDP